MNEAEQLHKNTMLIAKHAFITFLALRLLSITFLILNFIIMKILFDNNYHLSIDLRSNLTNNHYQKQSVPTSVPMEGYSARMLTH